MPGPTLLAKLVMVRFSLSLFASPTPATVFRPILFIIWLLVPGSVVAALLASTMPAEGSEPVLPTGPLFCFLSGGAEEVELDSVGAVELSVSGFGGRMLASISRREWDTAGLLALGAVTEREKLGLARVVAKRSAERSVEFVASLKTSPLDGLRVVSDEDDVGRSRRRERRTSWVSVRGRSDGILYETRWGVWPVGLYSMRFLLDISSRSS